MWDSALKSKESGGTFFTEQNWRTINGKVMDYLWYFYHQHEFKKQKFISWIICYRCSFYFFQQLCTHNPTKTPQLSPSLSLMTIQRCKIGISKNTNKIALLTTRLLRMEKFKVLQMKANISEKMHTGRLKEKIHLNLNIFVLQKLLGMLCTHFSQTSLSRVMSKFLIGVKA